MIGIRWTKLSRLASYYDYAYATSVPDRLNGGYREYIHLESPSE